MKNKLNAIMYYIMSTVCFVVSAISFIISYVSIGVVMLALGIATLCLGRAYLMNFKKMLKKQADLNDKKCIMSFTHEHWHHMAFNNYYDDEENRIIFKKECYGPLESVTYGITKKYEFYCKEEIFEPEIFKDTQIYFIDKQDMIKKILYEIELCKKYDKLSMIEDFKSEMLYIQTLNV